MKIVLDTNILIGSNLTSNALGALLEYASNSHSDIVITEVVYQEAPGVFERQLRDAIKKVEAAHREFGKLLPGLATPTVDVATEVANYKQRILDTFSITASDIMPYDVKYLNDVVNRAVYRKPPCNSNGEEIRDAVLWVMVKGIAQSNPTEDTVFIASNPKQFTIKEKPTELHPDLAAEVNDEALNIKFYNSIEAFLDVVNTKPAFLTEEWLNRHVSVDEVQNDCMLILESDEGQGELERWAKVRRIWLNDRTYPEETAIFPRDVNLNLSGFHFYPRQDGEYMVTATYVGKAKVDFDVILEVSMSGNDEEAWHSRRQVTDLQSYQPEIRAVVEIVVVGEEGIRHVSNPDVFVEEITA